MLRLVLLIIYIAQKYRYAINVQRFQKNCQNCVTCLKNTVAWRCSMKYCQFSKACVGRVEVLFSEPMRQNYYNFRYLVECSRCLVIDKYYVLCKKNVFNQKFNHFLPSFMNHYIIKLTHCKHSTLYQRNYNVY